MSTLPGTIAVACLSLRTRVYICSWTWIRSLLLLIRCVDYILERRNNSDTSRRTLQLGTRLNSRPSRRSWMSSSSLTILLGSWLAMKYLRLVSLTSISPPYRHAAIEAHVSSAAVTRLDTASSRCERMHSYPAYSEVLAVLKARACQDVWAYSARNAMSNSIPSCLEP
jgi:hypothetical protein